MKPRTPSAAERAAEDIARALSEAGAAGGDEYHITKHALERAALATGTHGWARDDFGNEYLSRLAGHAGFDWPSDISELLGAIDNAEPLQLVGNGDAGDGAVFIDPDKWAAIVGTRAALAESPREDR